LANPGGGPPPPRIPFPPSVESVRKLLSEDRSGYCETNFGFSLTKEQDIVEHFSYRNNDFSQASLLGTGYCKAFLLQTIRILGNKFRLLKNDKDTVEQILVILPYIMLKPW
jgi:hypothetical protein